MHTGTISSKVLQRDTMSMILSILKHIDDIHDAITREKRMKKWKREWKIELIEKDNPNWNDLYDYIAE